MDGESIDDIIPLATLIAFNGVNRYVVKNIYAVSVYCIPHGGYLITIRNNNSNSHILVKAVLCKQINLINRCCNHLCLNDIGF